MDENKWIVWFILFSSLLGIANKGISFIAFVLSIIILWQYQVTKKQPKTSSTKNEKDLSKNAKTNQKQLEKQELAAAKERVKKEKQQQIKNDSNYYFNVDYISEKVTKTSEASYYKRIKTNTEQVLDVVTCYSGKKYHYKNSTAFRVKKDMDNRGILILTTENVYFLSHSNGFVKEVFPINKVNGVKKVNNYDLEMTFGRSKKYFVLTDFQDPKYFVNTYLNNLM
ncbi:TPA: hypothetical protein P6V55_002310 [Staphylococcus aureus]|nr:hypothetical protein [Staphylococcus aureus]HDP5923568.1 hypothetical protein [Staphylococcus aureus]HDT6171995.1 hypothetical protein [Staphylococcus aureus]HDT6182473.1 hypothetical protein [Staphylococcus aureus]HDT6222266.1 hypothetical protein [Staphylococcus aureus]